MRNAVGAGGRPSVTDNLSCVKLAIPASVSVPALLSATVLVSKITLAFGGDNKKSPGGWSTRAGVKRGNTGANLFIEPRAATAPEQAFRSAHPPPCRYAREPLARRGAALASERPGWPDSRLHEQTSNAPVPCSNQFKAGSQGEPV